MSSLVFPLMLAAAICGVASQPMDCTTPEPCLEDYVTKLTPLLTGNNDTLFANANEPCGGDAFDVIAKTVASSCITEVENPPGCECSAGCSATASNITAACREAIIETYCQNAEWIEADLGVNLRSIFLHLLNDCYQGPPVDCPPTVPAFDPSVCAAPGPQASAAAPGSAGAPLPVNPIDDQAFTFQPIAPGSSLGEQTAADGEANPPEEVPPAAEVPVPESGGTAALSAAAAAALAAGALLLL